MGLASPRFTIRSMMIAVAIVGGLLGLYSALATAFSWLCLASFTLPSSAFGGGCFAVSVGCRRFASGPRLAWRTLSAFSCPSTGAIQWIRSSFL